MPMSFTSPAVARGSSSSAGWESVPASRASRSPPPPSATAPACVATTAASAEVSSGSSRRAWKARHRCLARLAASRRSPRRLARMARGRGAAQHHAVSGGAGAASGGGERATTHRVRRRMGARPGLGGGLDRRPRVRQVPVRPEPDEAERDRRLPLLGREVAERRLHARGQRGEPLPRQVEPRERRAAALRELPHRRHCLAEREGGLLRRGLGERARAGDAGAGALHQHAAVL